MAKIQYTFVFIDDTDGTTEKISTTEDISVTKKEAQREAYTKLADKYAVSPQQARSQWNTQKTVYTYASPPWSNEQELANALESIGGVNSIFSQIRNNGRTPYGPPKFHLHLSSSADPEKIEKEILNYYDGLTIESTTSRKVTVIISPNPKITS